MQPSEIIRQFHDFYYDSRIWRHTYWRATPILKCPLDLWVYQELLHRLKPDLIVECGTWAGGSALYLANILDMIGNGEVLTIDILTAEQVQANYIAYPGVQVRPPHPRIRQLIGSSIAPEIVSEVTTTAANRQTVMVIADSDHSYEHAYAELTAYAGLVTPGSYFIMEDTNIPGPGPRQAVQSFIAQNPSFTVDASMEKFYVTFNPGGFLRRQPPV